MLITHSTHSGRKEWWIMLETADGKLYDIHHQGDPFIGTESQVNHYADYLAANSKFQGLPVSEISLIPIRYR